MSAVNARAGTEVDDVVGLEDGLLVVLDDDHRVADVPERLERREQPLIVTLMQAYRRLIQDVHDAGEPRADLAREADPLCLASRECLGAAIQRQVIESDVHEEAQSVRHILDDLGGDVSAPSGQGHGPEKLQCLADRQMHGLRQAAVSDKHEPRRAVESGTAAIGTRTDTKILRQFLADGCRFSLAIAPLEVRQNALEGMALARRAALALRITELDDLSAAAVEKHLMDLRRELVPRSLDVEFVVPGQGLDELEVIDVPTVPAANRPAGEGQVRVQHDPLGIEERLHAQAVARWARARGVVEGEQLRLQRRDAVPADRAGVAAREDQLLASGLFQEGQAGEAAGESQGRLEGFGEPLG